MRSVCDSTGVNSSGFGSYATFNTGSCNISFGSQVSTISCNGLSDGSIDITPTGGSGVYTYLWDTGATTEDLSGLSAGTYSVVLSDTWGCLDSATFVITEPAVLPSLIHSLGSLSMCFGESRTLSLVGFASTANTYQWSDANGVIVGATSSSYIVSATGVYSLSVTSANGCVALSNTISISVLSTSVPSSLSASNLGLDNVTMNWASVANAHHYDIRMRVQGSSWSVSIDNIPGSLSSKQKANLQSSTTYEWSIRSACSSDTSTSSAWSSTQSFSTLSDCSDKPDNLDAVNITFTSADLTWDAVTGAIGYQVRFKEVGSSWGSWIYDMVYVSSLSKTGLVSDTEYEWEVRAFCDSSMIGVSDWNDKDFETLEPCGDAYNLSVPSSSLGSTTAELKWKPKNADHFTVIFRDVLSSTWDTLLLTGNTVTSLTTLPVGVSGSTGTQGSYRELALSGLTGGTTYEWEVMVSCEPGDLNNSSFVSGSNFTTSEPCALPNNLSVSTIGLDNVTMHWFSTSSSIDHYNIRMRESGNSSWSINIGNISSYASSQSKYNLQSGTDYEWQIQGACAPGNSNLTSWSSTQSFSTLSDCSDKPDNLDAVNITFTSADLTWDAVTGAIGYQVRFKEVGSSWGSWIYDMVYVSSLSKTGLVSDTEYEWEVRAFCDSSMIGVSDWNDKDFETFSVPCALPNNLSVSNIGLDRVTMNWAATSNANHYDVRIRPQGGSWINLFNVYGTSKTKYVLSSGSTYEWQVRGVCSSDTSDVSAWTATQTVNTLTPCAKPQNTVVSSITSSQAMLGWDVGSAATSYDVRFKLQGSAWGAWQYTNGVTTNQLLQTSLSAGTYYHWQVRAVCGSSTNKSGWTSYNTFSTLSSNRITAGDTKLGENLNVYPNPTQGIFNISFIAEKVDDFEITIVDAFGKLVSYEDKQDFIGEYTKKVDLSNWPRGIYMVQIKTQDSFVSKRIVLQ